jgi:hypothetical protein
VSAAIRVSYCDIPLDTHGLMAKIINIEEIAAICVCSGTKERSRATSVKLLALQRCAVAFW